MAERERIARLLYEAHYPNGSVAWGWFQTSEATRQIHRDMADALLAAREGADEITQAIPSTFYAGTDTLFRVVQLVRIWQGAIRANQELEADLTTARERVAELEAREGALREALVGVLRLADSRTSRRGSPRPETAFQDIWTLALQTLNPHWEEQFRSGLRLTAQADALFAPTADRSAPDGEPDPALLATLKQQVFGTDPDPRPRGR